MPLLEVKGLTKRFGGLVAVNALDLVIEPGQIIGLIGPNGAGKTTAFATIAGFYKPEEGQVIFDGKNITGMRPDRICKLGLTRTFQVVKPFPEITVQENILVGAYNAAPNEELALAITEEIIEFMELGNLREQLAGSLPIAGRKRLEIAKAMATQPKMILLDEVMAGLRPTETDETIELVRKIQQNGVSILLVEHVMKVIMSLADKIVVVHHGTKIAEGAPQEIVHNQAVIDAYLGEAHDA
ncbi:MAG TPA: ABC transporter ATP-binding protein [Bellilinea sp.]|jgi:branched-chain amino acid transport system ATP-binding protein|nr:ABC transporter ATP-binding protein [Bellilinea sp.]